MISDDVRAPLLTRLRTPPSPSTVAGSLPVLFFGDLLSAEIVTVGLNPSDQEYLDRSGGLLSGVTQRFATLTAASRDLLSDQQCHHAIERMRNYFDDGMPVYRSWFAPVERVLDGFGASFGSRRAAHLDLVQEATSPTWSSLPPGEKAYLLDRDLPFLLWQIRRFPIRTVLCTSSTVGKQLRDGLDVTVTDQGGLGRLTWWTGAADVDGRTVRFAGWNIPLARATGLGAAGEVELGRLLTERTGPPT
jgi:hypothetical protein